MFRKTLINAIALLACSTALLASPNLIGQTVTFSYANTLLFTATVPSGGLHWTPSPGSYLAGSGIVVDISATSFTLSESNIPPTAIEWSYGADFTLQYPSGAGISALTVNPATNASGTALICPALKCDGHTSSELYLWIWGVFVAGQQISIDFQ